MTQLEKDGMLLAALILQRPKISDTIEEIAWRIVRPDENR